MHDNVELTRRAVKFFHTSSAFVGVCCRERSGILLRRQDREKLDRLAANQSARFARISDRKKKKQKKQQQHLFDLVRILGWARTRRRASHNCAFMAQSRAGKNRTVFNIGLSIRPRNHVRDMSLKSNGMTVLSRNPMDDNSIIAEFSSASFIKLRKPLRECRRRKKVP